MLNFQSLGLAFSIWKCYTRPHSVDNLPAESVLLARFRGKNINEFKGLIRAG